MLFLGISPTKEKKVKKNKCNSNIISNFANMKLSIIIPVYSTQNTLKRCLNSVLSQSFTDYEIILVDDESPDDSPQLCDEYAQKNKRIQVIHKKNGGLSDARNAGIAQAKGEYITFIDSDDAIIKDTLQLLMTELQQYPQIDILEYPIMERIGHPQREHLLSFAPQEYTESWKYWLKEQAYSHTYACNKIFRRKLFDKISFPRGKNFEDVQIIPYLIGLIPVDNSIKKNVRIRVTNVGCYLYYWNGKGITANVKYEDLLGLYAGQTLALIYTFKNIENQKEILRKYQLSINVFLTQIVNILMDIYEISGTYENCSPLIKYTKLIKQNRLLNSLKLKLLLIIGHKRLCKLNHLLHKVYRHH